MQKDDLGTRMKEFYENRSKTLLTRKIPIVVRVDGRSFHTFTRQFEKPFDLILNECLNRTMQFLCQEVQCCKIGYRQSDEISLILFDNESLTTEPFFDNEVQKITSTIASMTSVEFCKQLVYYKRLDVLEKWPTFDCRCFSIPETEVTNYIWWRTLDAMRNSIQGVAQSKFSHSQLLNKDTNQMQEMLFQTYGINWSKLPQDQKCGSMCRKVVTQKLIEKGPKSGEWVDRRVWLTFDNPGNRTAIDSQVQNSLYQITGDKNANKKLVWE